MATGVNAGNPSARLTTRCIRLGRRHPRDNTDKLPPGLLIGLSPMYHAKWAITCQRKLHFLGRMLHALTSPSVSQAHNLSGETPTETLGALAPTTISPSTHPPHTLPVKPPHIQPWQGTLLPMHPVHDPHWECPLGAVGLVNQRSCPNLPRTGTMRGRWFRQPD